MKWFNLFVGALCLIAGLVACATPDLPFRIWYIATCFFASGLNFSSAAHLFAGGK